MIIKKKVSKLLYILGGIFFLVLAAIYFANNTIQKYATHKLYAEVNEIPFNKVGVLLGTSKFLKNGSINLYYKHRLNAAVALFASGKIEYILVSGDNRHSSYNEPQTFKNDLVKMGIPEDKIYLDYAGFRTLDSMVRAKEVFGQESITVISQQFHNERAIYLAEKRGLNAVGFNAKDVSLKAGLKVQLREYLARVKTFSDLLFSKQPKFLGEKIEIGN